MATHTMTQAHMLTRNAGSSSLKLALFRSEPALVRVLAGQVERSGLPDALLTVTDVATQHTEWRVIQAPDHVACSDATPDASWSNVAPW